MKPTTSDPVDVEGRSADDRWHRAVNWENLRSIGSSPLASFSILMPFIGYAILYNERISSFLLGLGVGVEDSISGNIHNGEIGGDGLLTILDGFFDLDISTRLNFIYIGAVLIGVGTIIFRMRAPKTVQRHSSIESFFNSELERASARRLRTMIFTIQQRRPNVAQDLIGYAPWLDRNELRSLSLAYAEAREEVDQQIHADVLSSFYNVESRYCNINSAWVVMLLYALGIGLVAIPGLFFTARVLISIFL